MDPVNERKVFEMMVKLLSGDDGEEGAKQLSCTQYFMLTPKLLSDLTFNRRMRVMVIHNGPKMIAGNQWSLKNLIDLRKNQTN